MDSQPVKNAGQIQNLIVKHIRAIRRKELWKTVPIIVIVENNMGHEPSHMEVMVRDEPNLEFFFENRKKDKIGVRKTEQVTRDYQLVVEDRLGKNNILFDDALFSVSDKYETNIPAVLLLLRSQLEAYHWEIRLPTKPGGVTKAFLTGKNGSQQDDLYVAFAMALYWGQVYMNRRQEDRALGL